MPPDISNTNTTPAAENSISRPNFLALTEKHSPERREMVAKIIARIDEEQLEVVRVACVDTHGIVRVRPIEARLFSQAARNGVAFTTGLFAMDSTNSIFQNVFAADGGFGRETMGGAGDMLGEVHDGRSAALSDRNDCLDAGDRARATPPCSPIA
jgi:glutamine synthetase